MQLSEISFWGATPLLFLFASTFLLLWMVDRHLLRSFLRSISLAAIRVRRFNMEWRVAVAVAGGALLAVAALSALLMLCLPFRLLVPAAAVLALAVGETMGASVRTYMRCFNNTQSHRYYLLANGASFLESVIPCLRRSLRACIMPQARRRALPMALKAAMLFIGMLMGGLTVATAVAVTLLVCAAAWVASLVATLATAFLLKELKICS